MAAYVAWLMGLLLALGMTFSLFVGLFFFLVLGFEFAKTVTASEGEKFLLEKEKEEGVIKLPSGEIFFSLL